MAIEGALPATRDFQLGELPADCVAWVLSLCGPRDVARLALVCKEWAAAAASVDSAWRRRLPVASGVEKCFPALRTGWVGSGEIAGMQSPLRRLCSPRGVRSRDGKYVLMMHPETGAIRVHAGMIAFFRSVLPRAFVARGMDGSFFRSCMHFAYVSWFVVEGRVRLPFLLPAGRYAVAWRVTMKPRCISATDRMVGRSETRARNLKPRIPSVARISSCGDWLASPHLSEEGEWVGEDVEGTEEVDSSEEDDEDQTGERAAGFEEDEESEEDGRTWNDMDGKAVEEGEEDDMHNSAATTDGAVSGVFNGGARGMRRKYRVRAILGAVLGRGRPGVEEGPPHVMWQELQAGIIKLEPSRSPTDKDGAGLAKVEVEADLRGNLERKNVLFVDSLILTQLQP